MKNTLKNFLLKKINKHQDDWFQDNQNDYEYELERFGDYNISTYERAFEYATSELYDEFKIDGSEELFCQFKEYLGIDYNKYSQNKFLKLAYKFMIKFYKTLFKIEDRMNYYA